MSFDMPLLCMTIVTNLNIVAAAKRIAGLSEGWSVTNVLILSHSTLGSVAAVVRFGRHWVVASGIYERQTCCLDKFCKHGRDSRAVRKDTTALQGFPGRCWLRRSQACTCTAARISAGIVSQTSSENFTLRRHNGYTRLRRCFEPTQAKQHGVVT